MIAGILAFLLPTGDLCGSRPGPERNGLSIAPARVELTGARDRQALVVQWTAPDGSTTDVSAAAEFELDRPIVRVEAAVLAPTADGEATLSVRWNGITRTVPVSVKRVGVIDPLGFQGDILPILTKAGCNSGKCHGSAAGKDGFRLSLYGFDPVGDQYRITREFGGRRVNLDSPRDCLLTNKAAGKVPHTGGGPLEPESEGYRLLVRWLESGAAPDGPGAVVPVGIDVFPNRIVFDRPGRSHRIVVRARFSDGSDRDVTRFAVFVSNNDGGATVSEDGLVTASGPGEAFILARFDAFTEGVQALVRPGTPFKSPGISDFNEIDRLVHAKLNLLHIGSSDLADDERFLRRAWLDFAGVLPEVSERAAFLANTDPRKREKLIDRLIAQPEFLDLWTMRFAELLQIRTVNGISPKGLQRYDQWLRDRIRAGATLDQVLREIIPAVGGSFENPAVAYYQTETTPQLIAENVAQSFLGTRLQCAQCHNHPFDRWTMDDYYGFAVFFSGVGYKQAADPRELTVYDAGPAPLPHPVPGRTVEPKFLGGDRPKIAAGADRRAAIAQWLTERGNRLFARNLANIVWSHHFGRGIVEPVDDFRVSNPPSNPELLDHLAEQLVAAKFDVRPLARLIGTSRTYQQSGDPNPTNRWDSRNFSRQSVRRLRAEVLLDVINQVTESRERFPGVEAGGRAVRIPDGRTPNYFLTTFGRASRQTACACEVATGPTLSQALHLINGENTTGKISAGGVIPRLLREHGEPTKVAEQLYLRCLGRAPTAAEATKIAARLAGEKDPVVGLEDLFWALLNTNEFLFNH